MKHIVDLSRFRELKAIGYLANFLDHLKWSVETRKKLKALVMADRGLSVWLKFQVDPVLDLVMLFLSPFVSIFFHTFLSPNQVLFQQVLQLVAVTQSNLCLFDSCYACRVADWSRGFIPI